MRQRPPKMVETSEATSAIIINQDNLTKSLAVRSFDIGEIRATQASNSHRRTQPSGVHAKGEQQDVEADYTG